MRQQRQLMEMRRAQQQRLLRQQKAGGVDEQKKVQQGDRTTRAQMQILKDQKDIIDYEDKPAFHYWY